MSYMKFSRECEGEGCCVLTHTYGKPEPISQMNKPDAKYPSLWREIMYAVSLLPHGIGFLIYNIFVHSVLRRPKLPTWNWSTSITVIVLQTFRTIFRKNSLAFWRLVLSIPHRSNSHVLNNLDEAHFTVKKLNLPGILKDHDNCEEGDRELKAQWLRPETEKDNKVLLYLHGGGYCAKDVKGFLTILGELMESTKLPVFSVNYRLAPETRFPGALVDAVQAYFHLINHYKYDPKNIILVGDSAGGGLALSLMIYLRDHGLPLPYSSILMSPWIDLSYSCQSWLDAANYDLLPPRPDIKALMNPARFYLGPSQYHTLCKHPYASPLFASSFEHLPPILIQYGSKEVMSDEIRLLIKKLKTCAYTAFRSEQYEDMIHVFQGFPFAEAKVAFKNIETFVNCSDINEIKGEIFYK